MSAEPLPFPPADATPLGELQRLYRRICVLRTGGKMSEAAELERLELNPALAIARARGDEAKISALFAAEESRVADARVLAELLAPMLARSLNVTLTTSTVSPPPTERRRRLPTAEPGTVPSVADLIDGMLSQDSR